MKKKFAVKIDETYTQVVEILAEDEQNVDGRKTRRIT